MIDVDTKSTDIINSDCRPESFILLILLMKQTSNVVQQNNIENKSDASFFIFLKIFDRTKINVYFALQHIGMYQ